MRDVLIVEVLIPTFRRSGLLLRAIRSAQMQTHHDLIINVYDNASDDDTEYLVRKLCLSDSRIRYYRHSINIGVIQNYAFALANVTSPYFTYLADDDVLYPDCILQAITGLRANSDVVFWGGNTIHINADTGAVIRGTAWSWLRGGVYSSAKACRKICSGNHIEFQGLVFRTAMVRETAVNFSADISLPDVDFQLRLASHYRVGITRDVTAVMFAHDQSISSGVRSLSTYWPTMKNIGQRFIGCNPLSSAEARQCVDEWNRTTILNLLFIAGTRREHVNSKEHSNILTILREDYAHYFIARFGKLLLRCYSLPAPIPTLAWFSFKLVYVLIRPSIFLNRIFPYCLRTFLKPSRFD
jgi:glycosyltransferase involved in cell wall biosynthesis